MRRWITVTALIACLVLLIVTSSVMVVNDVPEPDNCTYEYTANSQVDSQTVDFHTCMSADEFRSMSPDGMTANALYDGQGNVYVNDRIPGRHSTDTLLHELGHANGYSHNDGGVMNGFRNDSRCEIKPITEDIATNWEDFTYISENTGYMKSEYDAGNISEQEFERATLELERGCDFVYYNRDEILTGPFVGMSVGPFDV